MPPPRHPPGTQQLRSCVKWRFAKRVMPEVICRVAKRLLNFLKRLLKPKEQPKKRGPSYLCKMPCPLPMAASIPPEPEPFDSELPKVHTLRAIKDTLEQWNYPKKPSEKELLE